MYLEVYIKGQTSIGVGALSPNHERIKISKGLRLQVSPVYRRGVDVSSSFSTFGSWEEVQER